MSPIASSGLPPWAWTGYADIFAVAAASTVVGWLLAFATLVGRRRTPWWVVTSGLVVLVSVVLVLAWWCAVAGASQAPRSGQFCLAPSDWVETVAPTCTNAWPRDLIITTLAWPLLGTGLALAVQAVLVKHRTLTVAASLVVAVATVVLVFAEPDGLATADMFSGGGIQLARSAAVDMAMRVDTGFAILGLASFAAMACAVRHARRSIQKRTVQG